MRLPCADGCEGRETPYNVYTMKVIFVYSRGWAPAPRQQEGDTMDQNASAKVLVLDFGAQYGQLIARRVRDLNVYSEIVPCDISADEIREMNASALILSGGPASVYAEDAPSIDPAIFDLGLPVLGFCYGHQITAVTLGGKVGHSEVGEYGRATITRTAGAKLFNSTPMEQTVWMSHRDAVSEVPEGFTVTASTDVCPVAAMECVERKIFTTQFHPEVKHSEYGQQLLSNFLFEICGLEPNWSMDNLVETMTAEFREKVGNDRVILALSGGVDSSVVAALGARAVGKQMTCVFINHGLLRKGEVEQVKHDFVAATGIRLITVDAADDFLDALAGVSEPERKRKIIGEKFIRTFEKMGKEIGAKVGKVDYLAQGTIYPDVIESLSITGTVIKSHHNVGGLPAKMNLKLVEPLRLLFKDEVRRVGMELGMQPHLIKRHPFPGPGLGIRILGDITPEKVRILQEADDIYMSLMREWGLYDKIWQAGVILLPIQSVGVMGDERTYENTVALRAVTSTDAMTADWAQLPYEFLAKVSNEIINKVKGVNRVVYDISSKPPATIEWE